MSILGLAGIPRGVVVLLGLVLAIGGICFEHGPGNGAGGSGGHAGIGAGGKGGKGGKGGTGGVGGKGGTGGTAGDGGTGGTGGTMDPIVRVTVDPNVASIVERQMLQLDAAAFDKNDEELTGFAVVWASSDERIAMVTEDGLVEALRPGEATISATIEGHAATATLTVTEAKVAAITFDTDAMEIPVDSTTVLVAHALDADGNTLFDRTFTWTSADEAVLDVDESGAARGLALGVTTVTAAIGEIDATMDATVVHRFVDVVAGTYHTCALNAAGAAWCWGENTYGQLGNGDDTVGGSATPLRVGAGLGLAFTQLVAGLEFTCGLSTEGDVWCWGSNESFVLGRDDIGSSSDPVLLPGQGFTAISAMGYGACGLDLTGAAWCWGYGSEDFELGNPEVTDHTPVPVQVVGPTEDDDPLSFLYLAHGTYHTCGLTASAQLYCWGYNSSGRIGDGTQDSVSRPKEPLPGEAILAVGVGRAHSCAVKADETTWCWGSNDLGQIFPFGDASSVLEPALRLGADEFVPVSFAFGDSHSCALDARGTAWCWGNPGYGTLGRSDLDAMEPGPIDAQLSFVSLASRGSHTCGLATDGKVYCWGNNDSGQLGNDVAGESRAALPVYGQ